MLTTLRPEILSWIKRKRKIRVWCGAYASPREWRTGASQWACSCTFLVPSFRESKDRSWGWFPLRSRSDEKLLLVVKLFRSQMISFFFLGVLFGRTELPQSEKSKKPYVLILCGVVQRGIYTVWMLRWERYRAMRLSEFWVDRLWLNWVKLL